MKTNINEVPLGDKMGIPSDWNNILGYVSLVDRHYADGWRDVVEPEIDPETEKLGDIYFDADRDVVTYTVLQKSQEEIQQWLYEAAKIRSEISFKKFIESQALKAAQSMTDDEAIANQEVFPFWAAGVDVVEDDKVQDWNPDQTEIWLWKLNGNNNNHTTQEGWEPRNMQYAWERIAYPEEVLKWVQPHAHNAYKKGAKVWYEEVGDKKYESQIDNNIHPPLRVEGDWKEI